MKGILLFFCCLVSLSARASPPTRLTLESAISTAVHQATSVLKARNQAELSAAALLEAYARFLPDLRAGASLTESTGRVLYTFTGVTPVDSRFLSASLLLASSLNLFNGLADLSAVKASLERKDAAHLSLAWAQQQIALDVAQSYYQAALDRDVLTIARSNLAASRARLKLLQNQVDVGSVSTADLFRQQAQTSSDEAYEASSESRWSDDQLSLIRKLALDPAADYELEPPPVTPVDSTLLDAPEETLIRTALERREDLKAQLASVQAAGWDVRTAKAPYLPRLDLGFGRVAAGTTLNSLLVAGVDTIPLSQTSLAAQLGQQVEYSIGLTLSWTLFDRLQTLTEARRAEVAADNSRLDLEDLRRQVTTDVRRIKADFASIIRQAASAKSGVEAARKADAVIEERYRVGSASFIDVLAARSALVQAQVTDAQVRISLKLEEISLRYATGQWELSG